AAGVRATHYAFSGAAPDGTRYLVSYIDLPPVQGSVDKYLKDFGNSMVAGLQGKIQNDKRVTLGSNSGRELAIETSSVGGMYRTRHYLVGSRLYQLIIVGSPAK